MLGPPGFSLGSERDDPWDAGVVRRSAIGFGVVGDEAGGGVEGVEVG